MKSSAFLRIALALGLFMTYSREHGIIHSDLKPANLKVALDGQMKVLDLGWR